MNDLRSRIIIENNAKQINIFCIFAAQIERFNGVNSNRTPDGLQNQRFELKIKSLTSSWVDVWNACGYNFFKIITWKKTKTSSTKPCQ